MAWQQFQRLPPDAQRLLDDAIGCLRMPLCD